MSLHFSHSFFFCAAVAMSALVAQAGDLASAKAGMRERVPVVDRLKSAGAVGEASSGMLAVRTPGAEADAVVASENADRTLIFAELSKKSGASADAAGRAFAKQIAAASKAGIWLQADDGSWQQKR